MKKPVIFEIRLPQHIKVDSIDITTIPLDPNWPVRVREEGQHRIKEIPLGIARQKFGSGLIHEGHRD